MPVSTRLKRELMFPDSDSLLVDIQFSAKGDQLIAGDYPGGIVQMWDVQSGKQLRTINTGPGLHATFSYFYLSPSWDILLAPKMGQGSYERIERDGKRFVDIEHTGHVLSWDLTANKRANFLQHDPARRVLGLAMSPDGKKALSFDELPGEYELARNIPRTVTIWDLKTEKHISLPPPLDMFAKFSQDSMTVAATSRDPAQRATALKLFDSATGKEKLVINNIGGKRSSFLIDFIQSRYVLTTADKSGDEAKPQSTLDLWDAMTGKRVSTFQLGPEDVFAHSNAQLGNRFVFTVTKGNDRKLCRMRTPDLKELWRTSVGTIPEGHFMFSTEPCICPDGEWIAIGIQSQLRLEGIDTLEATDVEQPRIQLINARTGQIVETLISSQGFIRSVTFSPDGKTLATGGLGRVLLWDMTQPPGKFSAAAPKQ